MSNGMLSQEEIDALLRGSIDEEVPSEVPDFSEVEKDAIGEIANISMGTAATTLSLLLGKKVEITTPKVDLTSSDQIKRDYPVPSVIVDVKYKTGIEGSNILILSQRDSAVIVDIMMGGNGLNPSPELSEIQISGISEAMNQMMGSAATSMSTMFKSIVDITPPKLLLNDMTANDNAIEDFLLVKEPLIRISFRMVVEDVIDSTLVQVLPVDVAKRMVAKLMGVVNAETTNGLENSKLSNSQAPVNNAQAPVNNSQAQVNNSQYNPPYGSSFGSSEGYGSQMYGQPVGASGMQGYGSQSYGNSSYGSSPHELSYSAYPGSNLGYPPPNQSPITPVQPAQFAPLRPSSPVVTPDNLELILDVPLQVSVELGKARKTIKEILELGPGSVIELDRLAGEPVDMIVNGKLVAKCEVVVVNETFGIRITDIVQPAERMKSIN